ncbi:Ribosomal RNA large subunit methyltransferase L [Dyadobacter sp. CECT 9275]|uniref:Ribosomal RNA large subunit methyltransferase L n=1 Tax=Dyadobacter helix TaxID=2822344 RepID=A0A916JHV6_9BACT|nr:class I SAM-dependent RNA methyltransferase [Dyadobacter sp. CECT 9275]CAG5016615.1 Ribosomal RNA large subunit methyltransferase L [Dyadobacter sp. CECT 9275]
MMFSFQSPASVTITCHKWHAPYLEKEVSELGFKPIQTFVTGVKIRATLNDCIRLNLNLNCASQVLYSLGTFKATNANAVYNYLARLEWENILPEEGYFSVTSNVRNPTISNSMFANVKVKDAIVDRIRNKKGIRPSTGSDLTGAVVHLYWNEEDAEIFLDTSGESLARHGYRKIPGKAPMLEALASSTILASKWDRKTPFINPMCGSGTLAIEAALLATNTKPGVHRADYAFMHLNGYDAEVYYNEMDLVENQIVEIVDQLIVATDHDEEAISNARKNAIAAGVADLIKFEVCDFRETYIPENGNGVVFMNPEYGERLGSSSELEETYREMGDFMKKKCGGYYGYIFTGNLDLAKKIGLKAKRRIEFFTGKIDCRLLEYELYAGSKAEKPVD